MLFPSIHFSRLVNTAAWQTSALMSTTSTRKLTAQQLASVSHKVEASIAGKSQLNARSAQDRTRGLPDAWPDGHAPDGCPGAGIRYLSFPLDRACEVASYFTTATQVDCWAINSSNVILLPPATPPSFWWSPGIIPHQLLPLALARSPSHDGDPLLTWATRNRGRWHPAFPASQAFTIRQHQEASRRNLTSMWAAV